MKRKVTYILVPVVLATSIALGVHAYSNDEDTEDFKVVSAYAKHSNYGSLEQLEQDSELIIIGRKVAEDGVLSEIPELKDQPNPGFSISTFDPIKVIKSSEDFNKDKNIFVYEGASRDIEKKIIYTIGDYELMENNEKYILFLRESTTNPNHYVIIGLYYGKMDLNNPLSEKMKKNEAYSKVYEETKIKYKKDFSED